VRAGARATDVRADELTGTLITSAGDGKRRQHGRVPKPTDV